MATPELTKLDDNLELREEKLPEPADWEEAVRRAGKIFGLTLPHGRSATSVGKLTAEVQEKARAAKPACADLVSRLADVYRARAVPVAGNRKRTADGALALVAALCAAASPVQALATAAVPTTEAAMGVSIKKAAEVAGAIADTHWDIFAGLEKIQDERAEAAQEVLAKVAQALVADEHATALRSALQTEQSRAIEIMTNPPKPSEPPRPPIHDAPPDPTPPPRPPREPDATRRGNQVRLSVEGARQTLQEIVALLEKDPSLVADIAWSLYRKDRA